MSKVNELLEARLKTIEYAKELPEFAEIILEENITGEEREYTYLGNRYKELNIKTGIHQVYYDRNNPIGNYPEPYEGIAYTIGFNAQEQFGDHYKDAPGLSNVAKHAFFYDNVTSVFYVTRDNLITFLDELLEWYNHHKTVSDYKLAIIKKDELKDKLENLCEQIKEYEKELNINQPEPEPETEPETEPEVGEPEDEEQEVEEPENTETDHEEENEQENEWEVEAIIPAE